MFSIGIADHHHLYRLRQFFDADGVCETLRRAGLHCEATSLLDQTISV